MYLQRIEFEKFTAPAVILSGRSCFLNSLPEVTGFLNKTDILTLNKLDGFRKLKTGIDEKRIGNSGFLCNMPDSGTVLAAGKGTVCRRCKTEVLLDLTDRGTFHVFEMEGILLHHILPGGICHAKQRLHTNKLFDADGPVLQDTSAVLGFVFEDNNSVRCIRCCDCNFFAAKSA